ncbi:UNVERIFIED_CONTAM: hypothetical protein HHA_461800 [Hammondia hammondi]|eukprot:XP_008889378.1 hypothetical protein HHA_461800 [Hammondia hammondi]
MARKEESAEDRKKEGRVFNDEDFRLTSVEASTRRESGGRCGVELQTRHHRGLGSSAF